jgi:alkanesulfonate monooxygenase SsuD/methylene tetrahydromethanopterin reductase-like flavin-dependent oxidoreductase (luciferase family)
MGLRSNVMPPRWSRRTKRQVLVVKEQGDSFFLIHVRQRTPANAAFWAARNPHIQQRGTQLLATEAHHASAADSRESPYSANPELEPRPVRADGPPIWIGSWGSDVGIRRVARLADGWLASAYNLSPEGVNATRAKLGTELARRGMRLDGFPCSLATMWTYVTEDRRTCQTHLSALARMLNRPAIELRGRALVGPAEDCAATLRAYADAGIDHVFVWPVADAQDQLERVMRDVVPLV